jgi:xanthine phosphoribosyltransferase
MANDPRATSPYKDEIVISWAELHRDARYLCRVLHDLGEWKGIVAITRGGLIPAALIARELEIRLIDTVCVVSYGAAEEGGGDKLQGQLKWLKKVEGDGDGWLLVDDLVDTGATAKAVRQMLPRAHFAALYAKPLGRPMVDTFVKEFKQEKWIYFPWDIDYQFVSPIKNRRGAT